MTTPLIALLIFGHVLLFMGTAGVLVSALAKDSAVLRTAGALSIFGVAILNSPVLGWVFNPLPVFWFAALALVVDFMVDEPVARKK